jgi:enterochelin esterase family protein
MPDAPPQPWTGKRPGVPAGRIDKHSYTSVALKNDREVTVYLPPQYSPQAEPYPLLVLFDEDAYLSLVPTPTILDNLIADRRIPPMVALLIGNADDDARDRELLCNPEFTQVLVTEILPWAHGLYNFTTDPRGTLIAGSSLGGIAAACAALWHPETFGNVLSQSGAFHRAPPSASNAAESAEPNWLARQFIASPTRPLRFYLDAGSAEFNATGESDSILFCTRTLRDVLRAKGYEVHYQEFAGGHDYLSWRGTLADGLIALLGAPSSKMPPAHTPAQ